MKRALFVCEACGAVHPKWHGRCPDCGEWNRIVEQPQPVATKGPSKASPPKVQSIADWQTAEGARIPSKVEELDRVLGGGFVRASTILLGGDPGIGKSTLLLQAAAGLAQQGVRVLYLAGEESPAQVRMRAERIGALQAQLLLASACEVGEMLAAIDATSPQCVIVDSIQTAHTSELSSAPGSVAQVRECASRLVRAAKAQGFVLALVGHVTKEGAIAGPRVLEHLVDVVLAFEGEKGGAFRILRAVKNRFGAAGEIGVFEMSEEGLIGVREASRWFLAERAAGRPGSVVLACIEGMRPVLVEVQALVAPTVYATPRRAAVGVDPNRLAMLAAVLERRLGISLAEMDIYLNIVGGLKVVEPAADLAVAVAIVSALRNAAVDPNAVCFGEVGLTGEVRPVARAELRIAEAAQLGFGRVVLPAGSLERVRAKARSATIAQPVPVRSLGEAIDALMG